MNVLALNEFEREVIRVAHRLSHGEGPDTNDRIVLMGARLILKPFNPRLPIIGCSNGAKQYFTYVAPRFPPKGRGEVSNQDPTRQCRIEV